MATQLQIPEILHADCAVAQLRNDLLADSSLFTYRVMFSPKESQSSYSLESALRMSADWYGVPLADIAVQDADDEDDAYLLWIYTNQTALELSDVFNGEAWVDERCDLHPAVCVMCSPKPDEEHADKTLSKPIQWSLINRAN